jgi:hypothetical protein
MLLCVAMCQMYGCSQALSLTGRRWKYGDLITDNCDDEGCLFPLSSLDLTYVPHGFDRRHPLKVAGTTTHVSQYLRSFMMPTAPKVTWTFCCNITQMIPPLGALSRLGEGTS